MSIRLLQYNDATGVVSPSSLDPATISSASGSVSGAVAVTNGGAPNSGKLFKLDSLGKAAARVLEDELPILKARLDITNAQLKTLAATPRTVVAAPGAAKYIEVVSVHWWFKYTAPAFDGVAAEEDLVLRYTNAAGAACVETVAGPGFGDATADKHALRKGIDVVPVVNAAIVASINSGEWFAAAGAGTLTLEVSYIVRDFTF